MLAKLNCGAQRLRRAGLVALAAGLALHVLAKDGDPAPATGKVPKPPDQPTADGLRLPRVKNIPGLHPEDSFFYRGQNDDFRTTQPPFVAPAAPPESPMMVPSSEQQDQIQRKRDWIIERPGSQTTPESIQKLFKAGNNPQLGDQDDKARQSATWMTRFIDGSKPTNSKMKSQDLEKERSSDPFETRKSDRQNSKADRQSKSDQETFKGVADRWDDLMKRSSQSGLLDTSSDAARELRPDSFTAASAEKRRALQRQEFNQMINLPGELTFMPKEALGSLDGNSASRNFGSLNIGLDPSQAGQDSSSQALDRGLSKSASGSSSLSVWPASQGGEMRPPQLPSLDSLPAGITTPRANSGFLSDQPRAPFQPAVLPLPTRPGFLTPQHW